MIIIYLFVGIYIYSISWYNLPIILVIIELRSVGILFYILLVIVELYSVLGIVIGYSICV